MTRTAPIAVLYPRVSVDAVRVRLLLFHRDLLFSSFQQGRPYWYQREPFKLNLGNTSVFLRSVNTRQMELRFNPAAIDHGHSLYLSDQRISDSVVDAVLAVARRVAEPLLPTCTYKPSSRYESGKNSVRLRSGHHRLWEIDLAADWVFPTRTQAEAALRELRTRWTYSRTRERNAKYVSTLYLNHSRWDCVVYDKSAEVQANNPAVPAPLARNRLRIEITLRGDDIRHLGKRLKDRYPEMPLLDFTSVHTWDSAIYDMTFDLYASRLRPIGWQNKHVPKSYVLLYDALARHAGKPAHERNESNETIPQ